MEFPSIEQLRARGTRKWTVYDEDVLPLWIAESDFPTAPAVAEEIQRCVSDETFGYSPAPKASGLPEAVSNFYSNRFGWRPNPSHVFWIGDVVRGLVLGVQNFTRPDSPVIVPTPAYPPFLEIPKTVGREKIETSLDLNEIEEAFARGAGSILLCNPYNPLGKVLDSDFLSAIAELAHRYSARILADEIHAPLVYSGQHIPIASLAPEHTITVTATSKAWNTAGLKCAQIIFSNNDDAATWRGLTGVARDGTGTLGIFAAEAAYRHGLEFLDKQVEYLSSTRTWLCEQFAEKIPGLKHTVPDATYLMWLDFREFDLEKPGAWLVENARVALNEGLSFGAAGRGHARLNFSTSRDILSTAVDRIADALAPLHP